MKLALKAVVLGFLMVGLQTPMHAQVLLSYWNFNNDNPGYSSSTTNLGSFNTTAAVYGEQYASGFLSSNTANGTIFHSAAIKVDFTNIPVGVTNPIINGKVTGGGQGQTSTSFGGYGTYTDSTLNQVSGDTTTGNSMIIMNPSSSENGHYITLTLDSSSYQSLTLSYVTRLTTGYTGSEAWSYSLNGTTFFSLSTLSLTADSAFHVKSLNLSSLSSNALDNQGVYYLRMTVNSTGGSLAFDNLQVTGTSVVPEPSTYALIAGGFLLLVVSLRRKRQSLV